MPEVLQRVAEAEQRVRDGEEKLSRQLVLIRKLKIRVAMTRLRWRAICCQR
jgi:hypothetical protein